MTQWRKSSRSATSDNTDCVEVAALICNIGVRDSKNPHGPQLTLPTPHFRDLVQGIKNGKHDLA